MEYKTEGRRGGKKRGEDKEGERERYMEGEKERMDMEDHLQTITLFPSNE